MKINQIHSINQTIKNKEALLVNCCMCIQTTYIKSTYLSQRLQYRWTTRGSFRSIHQLSRFMLSFKGTSNIRTWLNIFNHYSVVDYIFLISWQWQWRFVLTKHTIYNYFRSVTITVLANSIKWVHGHRACVWSSTGS